MREEVVELTPSRRVIVAIAMRTPLSVDVGTIPSYAGAVRARIAYVAIDKVQCPAEIHDVEAAG